MNNENKDFDIETSNSEPTIPSSKKNKKPYIDWLLCNFGIFIIFCLFTPAVSLFISPIISYFINKKEILRNSTSFVIFYLLCVSSSIVLSIILLGLLLLLALIFCGAILFTH